MDYHLLYGDRRIAEVTTDDADFPTFFGRYRLLDGTREDSCLAHVLAYVRGGRSTSYRFSGGTVE